MDFTSDEQAPAHQGDLRGEINSLRSELQQLRSEIARAKTEAVQDALSRIVLQGPGVSGGNGQYTIAPPIPTSGTGTMTIDCTQDPPVGNVTITLQ